MIGLIAYAIILSLFSVAYYVIIQYSQRYKSHETMIVMVGAIVSISSIMVLLKSLQYGSIGIVLPIAFTIKLVLVVVAARFLFCQKVSTRQIIALAVMIAAVIWFYVERPLHQEKTCQTLV